VIAVDTNILVYAHREETTKHELAKRWLFHLAEGTVPWGLPVFCIGEYIRVITHRNVFDPPSSLQDAVDGIEFLLQSPSIRLLNPGVRFFHHLKELLLLSETIGNLTFDAQIAALCREQGITNLLTDDRDFSRFPGIRIVTLEADMHVW
jgi:toxin-antitoxin system PIN domain toxin